MWYFIIIGSAIFLGLGHFFLKYASKSGGEPIILATLIAFFSFIPAFLIALLNKKEFVVNKITIIGAMAGLLIGIYVIGLSFAQKHLPVSIVTPVALILASAVAVLLGFLFLGEHFTLIKWLGFILLITGIILIFK